MNWQQETLRKLREARRCSNNLRYRISDVKILLYEYEEHDEEHALMVEAMNALDRLRKVLSELERKILHTNNDGDANTPSNMFGMLQEQ